MIIKRFKMDKVSVFEFKELVRKGIASGKRINKDVVSTPIVDDATRRITFTCSTASSDRTNDSIDQSGIFLGNYLKNPVVMYAHDTDNYPVAKCVQIGIVSGNLTAVFEFLASDVPLAGPRAEAVFQMVKQGYLSAVSIGFLPLEYEFSNDPERESGVDFKSVELTEISIVPVPCQPEALVVPQSILDIVEPEIIAERGKSEATSIEKNAERYEKLARYIQVANRIR